MITVRKSVTANLAGEIQDPTRTGRHDFMIVGKEEMS